MTAALQGMFIILSYPKREVDAMQINSNGEGKEIKARHNLLTFFRL